MSNIIFQTSSDMSAGQVQQRKGSGQGLSARSANIVDKTKAKGKNGKRKHAQITPSYMRPTKSFAPKQQSKHVDPSKCKKKRVNKCKLTVPESPALRSRVRSATRAQQTQARQSQRQEREAEQRKVNKARHTKMMKKALLPKAGVGTIRSGKSLTLPVPFHLETAERPRAVDTSDINLNTFPTATKIDTTIGLTQPKPFNLQTSARAKMHTDVRSVEPFKSTVQLMAEFHHKTPERFHSKPKAQEVPVLPAPMNVNLTVPETPNFNKSSRQVVRGDTEFEPMCLKVAKFHTKTPTRFRTVPKGSKPVLPSPVTTQLTNAVSPSFKSDERAVLKTIPMSSEELTLQYMEANKYKANPVNYKALDSCGDLGVPKLVSKESTVCDPFAMSVTNKLPQVAQEEETVRFKAKPINKKMMQQPLFIPTPSEKELTEAHSPVFQTKVRAAAHTSTCAPVETHEQFVAKPMPDMTYPSFVPQPSTKPLTEAEPFHLASKSLHEAAQDDFQEKIAMKQQQDHDERQFKAQPIVHSFPEHATKPAVERPLTEVEPFHFEGDSRSNVAKRSFQQRIKINQQAAADAAEFKARSMPNMSKKFTVVASEKELTTAKAPELDSLYRAEQRAEFDEHTQTRLAAAEAEKEKAASERQKVEQEEVKKLRKTMNFKAQPIFKGRVVQVKKSIKPLTVSQSPSFGSRSKKRRC